MAKTPVRKEAGQSPEELAVQLAAGAEGNRLYGQRAKNYKEISDELKAQALDNILDQQMHLLRTAKQRGRVNLHDVDELEAAAEVYLQSCKLSNTFPTMLSFAASLGYSRGHLYRFINDNAGTPAGQYLDNLRGAFAGVVAQMGLARQCSEPVAIFLLKNSGQGLTDRVEIEASAKTDDRFGEAVSPEELQRKYLEDAYGSGAEE